MAAWIEHERPAEIGGLQWDALQTALAPVSSGYLRRLLRDSGVELAPMVEGVRQESFESLERTLVALLDEYDRGDAARRALVRKLVIEAKDHARLAAKRRRPSNRAAVPPGPGGPQPPSRAGDGGVKQEMILWMLTWLENPPLFREWLALRKRAGGI